MPPLTPSKHISAQRTFIRILLFSGIAALTGWLTFTTYSAKLHQARTFGTSQNGSTVTKPADAVGRVVIDKTYGKLPLTFEANLGQTDPIVKYMARGPGYNIFLTPAEAVLVFLDRGDSKEPATESEIGSELRPGAQLDHQSLDRSPRARYQRSTRQRKAPTVVRMQLVGANPNPQAVEGRDERPGRVNYFIGNDSSKWLDSIPTYGKVAYNSIYPGVDLVYYGNRGQLEYDLVVAPGTDPNVIQINFDGAESLRVDRRGDLLLKTKAGEIRQMKPSIFQEVNGTRKQVHGGYVVRQGKRVGFKISRYDRRKPLLIDPVLSYFALVNNSFNGYAIAVDAQGFAYVTGTAPDAIFNPTPGGFQQNPGGNFDGFVTKVSPGGGGVVYSTYIGGAGFDECYGIAVDGQGNAYVTGYAETGFPVTSGAFQTTPAGSSDAFVTKLNPSGGALVYSTFFGGNRYEEGNSIAVDSGGNAYVAGLTESTNLPVSAGAGQTSRRGAIDSFIVSLNAAGSALRYATYFGGNANESPQSIAIDSSSNAYVVGSTGSLDLSTVNSLTGHSGLNRGLFKSVDSASNWSLSRNGLTDSHISAMAVAPSVPTTVYLGTNAGVFRSTDAGANWVATNINTSVRALVVDPTNSSIVYAGSGEGIFKTADSGATWTVVDASSTFSLAIDPATPTTVFAGRINGILKTTNGGTSWNIVLTSGNIRTLAIDPSNPSIVYAGRQAGVLKTTNGGTNWSSVNTGLTNTNVRSLAIVPNAPATVYAGTFGGVFKTTDAAANWAAVNNGFLTPYTDNVSRIPAQVNALAIDPSTPSTVYAAVSNSLIASGAYPLTSVLKSTDAGANWAATTNGFGGLNNALFTIAVDPGTPARIYAGTSGNVDGFVVKVNPSGSAFPFVSYLGGGRGQNLTGVAVDSSGDAYITGVTSSPNFPTTAGAYQTTLRAPVDLFVTKISTATNTIAYSTYLGGNGFDEGIVGIAVDSAGNAYVNGKTSSTDFPVTPGAFQTTIGNRGNPSNFDETVTKLNPTGSALVYSSYLGGAGNEHLLPSAFSGTKIAVDSAGSAYVVGRTNDNINIPVFDGLNDGLSNTYIAKIDGNQSSYSITGRLTTSANAPIAGVFVEAIDGQGFSHDAISDSQGFYSLISLPAGDYTVTPSKFAQTGFHYLYTPTSQTFTGLNSDQTANFTGTQVYTIAGVVTSSTVASLPIFDVTLTLSGAASGTVVTNADGNYTFDDLLPGNYVVTPSKPGFTFTPASRTFTNLSIDQFSANFTTASGSFFTVGGRAADAANNSISNATVTVLLKPQIGSRTLTTQTDANGNYSFPNLQSGGNYTFLATKPLISFTPQNPSFSNLSASQTLNFLGAQVTGLVGKFVFHQSPGIYVMNADTSGETLITFNGHTPVWSPDGSKIAFASGRDAVTVGNLADLYVMNPDGTAVTRVTNTPFEEVFPSWSPNQQQLTYTYGNLDCKNAEFGPPPDVLVINANGTSSRNLTNTVLPDGISDWSPGGSSITFIRVRTGNHCNEQQPLDIFAMDSLGGNERLLVNTADAESGPSYSPDGSRIAYFRKNFDPAAVFADSSLWVMNADGTDQIKIGPDIRSDEDRPTWSPDGTKIAFSGNLPGDFGPEQMFVINADGTGFAQLTSGGNGRTGPSWQHYSISGRVNGNINGLPVTMVLAGTLTRVTQTDANGNYVFGNLTPGGNYSVTPVSNSFVFIPARVDVNNLVGNQIANFNATQAIPTATPPLADDFAGAQRDPTKWNLGTQTQPLGAFDPQVTVLQQSGRLVITPRRNVPGLHYNGYVAVNSFDFNNGTATVEVVETATNGAETIFAIGSDLENFSRFVVSPGDSAPGVPFGREKPRRPNIANAPELTFQVRIGGQLTSLSIPYDPVQHRYLRFRHEPQTNAIVFETSPDNETFTERHRVVLVRSVSALTAELSAGTSVPADPPGQAVFDNFQLVTNTFQFSAPSYSISEGTPSAQLSVTRTGNTASPATVEYSSFDLSATQRSKYILATGTLTFGPGETTKSLSVLVVDNSLVEGSQTLSLQLVDSSGSGLNSPGRAILTILDNDTTPPTSNPLDSSDAQFYVRQHYYDFLSRIPDASGLAFWTNEITSCGSDAQCRDVKRVNVSAAYFLSIEFQETGFFVHRFYNAALNRANGLPRYLEFLRDTQTIGRGVVVGAPGFEAILAANKVAYANQFASRPEFTSLYPSTLTPTQFVDALYVHALIGPNAAERQAAIDEFSNPTGARGRVLRRVVDNQALQIREFNRAFVLAQYFGYLRRNPDDPPDNSLAGFNFWLNKLNQFNGSFVDSEMVKSFIVSGEYRQRFGP